MFLVRLIISINESAKEGEKNFNHAKKILMN